MWAVRQRGQQKQAQTQTQGEAWSARNDASTVWHEGVAWGIPRVMQVGAGANRAEFVAHVAGKYPVVFPNAGNSHMSELTGRESLLNLSLIHI